MKKNKSQINDYSESDISDKYLQRNYEIKKRFKKTERTKWFWSKGIVLLNTFLSFIAAVASIIALLK